MAKILAVDDDPLIRRTVLRILSREGHEVVAALDGADALRLATDHAFDVALVDYEMPLLDGLEVLHRLRELQPGCLRVLVTGCLDLPLVMDAVNRGEVSRVVEKPFQHTALVAAVEESLDARLRMVEVCRVQQEAVATQERDALVECLQGEFLRLALQPIVRASDNQPVAYEALLRSRHALLDAPLAVLGAAEGQKMLPQLAKVVADLASGSFSRVADDAALFVNLHPEELADPDGMEERLSVLGEQAPRVVLEITERSHVLGVDSWAESVRRLREMGFLLAVDDLGAGYSSLGVLAEVQPDYIKVDMSIVRDVHQDSRKQRLVDLLVRFADATDAKLIAEGVEQPDEADVLRRCGAHMLQGYLFGRPTLGVPRGAPSS